MIPHSWKIFLLLTIVFINVPVKSERCTLTDLGLFGTCRAEIICANKLDIDIQQEWRCIKHTRHRSYDYYYNREREEVYYDDDYDLVITIFTPKSTDLFGDVDFKHFNKLSLIDAAEIIFIPEDIFKMMQLTKLTIRKTQIASVNFDNFLPLSYLIDINLSDNFITVIDSKENDEIKQSDVKTIDVSYNFIEILPDNFLSSYTQLQRLNLSHNHINSINIHTFEGIVQLKTLDLSHNGLLEIGNAFARFVNLREMSISNNNLTKLNDYNFLTLTNMENLNISYNNITTIESHTFHSLSKIEILDLSHNKLETITKELFENNPHLYSLSLLDNQIFSIEANSFKDNNITDFSIQNNHLTGAIEKDTLKGINVNELNLSGENLTSIKNEAFTEMPDLVSLDLSLNAISNISDLAFSSLESLDILDLSHNKLNELSFESKSLINLTKLYAHHNDIKKITVKFFENLESLKVLDLSFNDLNEMEPKSFSKLNNLELMTLKSSHFLNTLESNALQGLTSLNKIEMSETRTSQFKNESFSGLYVLTFINSSFGQLAEIEYNAFIDTGSLNVLILSNNQLHNFNVNVSTITQIQDIDLSSNRIRNVSNETFSHLLLLRNLNISNNDIIQLKSEAFQYLKSLKKLDLSSNERMKIVGNPLANLNLEKLSLQNVKTDITFNNSIATIESLVLQSCGIKDINKVFVYNIKKINNLYLSMNYITTIDKDSFKNMPTLEAIDLSSNNIMHIQPGSFLHLSNLRSLNLFNNNLSSLQFGVFDGLKILLDLDLSRNVLSDFDVKLLHIIRKLTLDDNIITSLRFKDFFEANIIILSIGGNQISCKVLAELKTSNYSQEFRNIVTAKKLDYHSQNVNGITCQNSQNESPTVIPVSNNPSFNIGPLISSLRNTIEKFDQFLQAIGENSHKSVELKDEAKTVIKSIEDFIESSNKSQITNTDYIAKLTDIYNNSNTQLEEIKRYVMLLTDIKKELQPTAASTGKANIDDQYLREEFQKMLKQENDVLRKEFKNALASISKTVPLQQSLITHEQGKRSDDSHTVFYFIAVCLAVMMAAYLGNIIFQNFTRLRRSYVSQTRSIVTPISNSIEME